MTAEALLHQFDENQAAYAAFATAMGSLLSTLLKASNVDVHSIDGRVKERSSVARKIQKKDKYSTISDITDIVGLRIICHFADEVDEIAKIIEDEFLINSENSIDKRTVLDPDRFGYLSLHYVVSLKPDRASLLEYKRFSGLNCEIQVRSILQHTWAEIEHDIGYKAKIEVPRPIRRKFSRLAGLLELADDQFIQIRNDLEKYQKEVKEQIPASPEEVGIDAISVYEYANNSSLVRDMDEEVSQLARLSLNDLDKEHAASHLKYLRYFGIQSISDLESALTCNRDNIMRRARDIEGNQKLTSRGISIFYLHHVLAAKNIRSKSELINFLTEMSLSLDKESFADYLLQFRESLV